MSGQIITENALDSWVNGNEREAQGVLVELVARLVRAQCPCPLQYRFPRPDSIGQHGIDGILDSSEAYQPYINQGLSYWEFGANAKPQTKITKDYKKRTESVSPEEKEQSTFVFVTPRSAVHTLWTPDKQKKWKEKRQNDGWKDIKIMDATILCDWLSLFPAISAWMFQKILNKTSLCFETPPLRWKILENIFEPHRLNAELFLTCRDELCYELDVFFNTPDRNILRIQTHYPSHLSDFIAAFIKKKRDSDPTDSAYGKISDAYYDNVLILRKAEDLDHYSELQAPHIFILEEYGEADYMARAVGKIRTKGHRLILPCKTGGQSTPFSNLILPMPESSSIQVVLEKMGMPPLIAQGFAAKSNGNIPCLLRIVSNFCDAPYWGGQDAQSILAIANLIGEWDENAPADLLEVEAITGKKYEEWKNELVRLPEQATTPLRYHEGKYRFTSRYEGWQIGGNLLTKEILEHFFTSVENTLSSAASSEFADPFQRILAARESQSAVRSNGLTESMAEMLAIMASNSNFWTLGSPEWIEARIQQVVAKLLDNDSPLVWQNLGSLLPLLAEASPVAFLEQLGKRSKSKVFLDGLTSDSFFSNSAMTSILWGLECLAWDSRWFPQSIALLGDLAQAAGLPKNSANKPSVSFKEIFCLWRSRTCADEKQRSNLLKTLAKKYPLTAWKVILDISPHNRGTIYFGTCMPRWRDISSFKQEEQINLDEWISRFEKYTSDTLEILLQHGNLPLEELVKGLRLIPQRLDDILKHFTAVEGTEKRKQAWELLSNVLRQLDRHAGGKNYRPQIISAIESLSPTDKCEHLKVYFEDVIPDYVDNKPFEEQLEAWRKKQSEIVASLLHEDGLPMILHLVSLVKKPSIIGQELARIGDANTDACILPKYIPELDRLDTPLYAFLCSYIRERYIQEGSGWLQKIFSQLTPEEKLHILICVPFVAKAWSLVEELPKELQQKYWARIVPWQEQGENDFIYPLQKIIEVNRKREAIWWLYQMLIKKLELPVNTLKDLLLHPGEYTGQEHYLTELVEYLQRTAPDSDDDLVSIEFLWIDLFSSQGDQEELPKRLNKKLLSDPELFIEALIALYKPRSSKKKDEPQDEETKRWARHYYKALEFFKFASKHTSVTGDDFIKWLNKVLEMAKECDRHELACMHIGQMLFYSPPSSDGFWIDLSVASILNEHEKMLQGFVMESINSRGAYFGSYGEEEKALSEAYTDKANGLREKGFFNFANCVDSIAKDFIRQANREKEESMGDF